MPTYVARCPNCHASIDYIRKVDERDDTPEHCGVKTQRALVAPRIQAVTITQGILAGDGNTYYGKSEYDAYLKKNDLLPSSELKGEAAYRRKVNDQERRADIRKTVTDLVASTG